MAQSKQQIIENEDEIDATVSTLIFVADSKFFTTI
jgi:hypothetical protein